MSITTTCVLTVTAICDHCGHSTTKNIDIGKRDNANTWREANRLERELTDTWNEQSLGPRTVLLCPTCTQQLTEWVRT